MGNQETTMLILVTSITLFLVSVGLIFFLVFFIKTKNKNIQAQFELKNQYEKELFATQIELKDQVLQHVGRELHDNVGQLLTVARIHLKGLLKASPNDKLSDINELTAKALEELRKLSKALINVGLQNPESLTSLIQGDIATIQKMDVVNIHFNIQGDEYALGDEQELICYRIFQEFIANALKYAECTDLYFELNFFQDNFTLVMRDNGKGFDVNQTIKGNGLNNIENRTRMIGATMNLQSAEGKGTQLTLTLTK